MRVKAKLELTVWYDGGHPSDAKELLNDLVAHAVSNGLLSGDGPAIVDTFHHEVSTEVEEP